MLCPFNCALTVRSLGLACELSLTTLLLPWSGDDCLWDGELTRTGQTWLNYWYYIGGMLFECRVPLLSFVTVWCFHDFLYWRRWTIWKARRELGGVWKRGIPSKCSAGNEWSLYPLWTFSSPISQSWPLVGINDGVAWLKAWFCLIFVACFPLSQLNRPASPRDGDLSGRHGNCWVVQWGTTARKDWALLNSAPEHRVVEGGILLGMWFNNWGAKAKCDLISSWTFFSLFSFVLADSGMWSRRGWVSRFAVGFTYWNFVWFLLPDNDGGHRGVNPLCKFLEFCLENMTASLEMVSPLTFCITFPLLCGGSCE